MKHLRFVTLAVALVALPTGAFAQSSAGQADQKQSGVEHVHGNPLNHATAGDEHFKMLSEKLGLSSDQAAKVRPILKQMDDGTRKLKEDESLSSAERMDRVRALRLHADKKIRTILNDEQKKKLDQMEQEAHLDLHGMV